MHLLRMLALDGLHYNRRLTAKFVGTKENFLADALSRGQIEKFRKLAPEMNVLPDRITDRLWPLSELWRVMPQQ